MFEVGIAGNGDHHMAYALMDKPEWTYPLSVSAGYKDALCDWQEAVAKTLGTGYGVIGYVDVDIAHHFHGFKTDRGYASRWDIVTKTGFDPKTDLAKNADGLLEVTGPRAPAVCAALAAYFASRREDATEPEPKTKAKAEETSAKRARSHDTIEAIEASIKRSRTVEYDGTSEYRCTNYGCRGSMAE